MPRLQAGGCLLGRAAGQPACLWAGCTLVCVARWDTRPESCGLNLVIWCWTGAARRWCWRSSALAARTPTAQQATAPSRALWAPAWARGRTSWRTCSSTGCARAPCRGRAPTPGAARRPASSAALRRAGGQRGRRQGRNGELPAGDALAAQGHRGRAGRARLCLPRPAHHPRPARVHVRRPLWCARAGAQRLRRAGPARTLCRSHAATPSPGPHALFRSHTAGPRGPPRARAATKQAAASSASSALSRKGGPSFQAQAQDPNAAQQNFTGASLSSSARPPASRARPRPPPACQRRPERLPHLRGAADARARPQSSSTTRRASSARTSSALRPRSWVRPRRSCGCRAYRPGARA